MSETDDFKKYNKKLMSIQELSRNTVGKSMQTYVRNHRKATPEDIRAYGKECLTVALNAYGREGAQAACLEYDKQLQRKGIDSEFAEFIPEIEDGYAEKVLEEVEDLVWNNDIDAFIKRLSDEAYTHPRRAANRAMYRNATRKKAKDSGVRYARVPTGKETCGFCLMLSSLGFHYLSEETAGAGNRFHRHCDCTVWPSTAKAKISGYDPEHYLDVYVDARDTLGTTDAKEVAKEIERRTREWSWEGKRPEVVVSTDVTDKHKAIADKLADHGIAVELKNSRRSKSDVVARMNGRVYEFTEPATNDADGVKKALENAHGRVVIDVSDIAKDSKALKKLIDSIETQNTDATEVLLVCGADIRRIIF